MRSNRLRQALQTGRPTIGTHLHASWPSVVETVGHTGMFDYVEFVSEYAPYDLYALDNFCRAVELFDMAAMIKVDQEPRAYLAQRAIGAGFQSVLFADVRSANDARACVAAARPDTPDSGGTYGVTTRRHTYMLYGGTPDYVQALEDTVVVLMIEKRGAVEELEEILAVPGVDMIQWGPADYSMSVGRPGAWHSAETRAVEKRVFETALRMGIPPRAEISSPDDARRYLDMGVRHFCLGTDLFILFDWWKHNGAELRRVVEA